MMAASSSADWLTMATHLPKTMRQALRRVSTIRSMVLPLISERQRADAAQRLDDQHGEGEEGEDDPETTAAGAVASWRPRPADEQHEREQDLQGEEDDDEGLGAQALAQFLDQHRRDAVGEVG